MSQVYIRYGVLYELEIGVVYIGLYILKGVQGVESVLDARNYVFHSEIWGYVTDSRFFFGSPMLVCLRRSF